VSQYFKVGGTTVWNPSNGVGRLFVRSAEALAPVVDLPTGIRLGHPGDPDEWVIDMPDFEAFADALVDRYQRSTHLILRSLMEGFIATALVLVERGGGHVPSLDTDRGPDLSDVSVTAHGLGARAPAGRLGTRAGPVPARHPSVTFYQLGGRIPGIPGAEMVLTDRKSRRDALTDRKWAARPRRFRLCNRRAR
jgi:hypothetical protein